MISTPVPLDRTILLELVRHGLVKCRSCRRMPATRAFVYEQEHSNGSSAAQWPCCPDPACEVLARREYPHREEQAPYGPELTHLIASLSEEERALFEQGDDFWWSL